MSDPAAPPPFKPSPSFLMMALILFIPLMFFSIGLVVGQGDLSFYGKAVDVRGEVLSVRISDSRSSEQIRKGYQSSSQHTTYWPTVRYTTDDGETHTAEVETSRGAGGHGVGNDVDLLYIPDQPERVRIAQPMLDTMTTPLVLMGVGGGMAAIILFFCLWIRQSAWRIYKKKYGIAP